MRCPIVMAVVNRALSAPLNIHGDHSDMMGSRDSGWIQLFCENPQEAYHYTIQAFRLAESPNVLLPVAVNLDGFTVSHSSEPVEILPSETVQDYLPRRERPVLDYDNPMSFGVFALPTHYYDDGGNLNIYYVDAAGIVEELGRPRSLNLAMLGASCAVTQIVPLETIARIVAARFGEKDADVVRLASRRVVMVKHAT
jgi:pyruvate ferredoxin oxidoreductase alpha subunit